MLRASALALLLVVTAGCELLDPILGPPPEVIGGGRPDDDDDEGEEGEGEEGEGEGPVGSEGEGEGEGPVGGEGEGEGSVGGEGEGEDPVDPDCDFIDPPTGLSGTVNVAQSFASLDGFLDGTNSAGIEIYGAHTAGTFDLGSSGNSNYATCSECMRLRIDDADFFQIEGSLRLDEDPITSARFVGRASDVTFVEVDIDAAFESTPVPGGRCFTLISWTFDHDVSPN